ncbi:MAG: DegV family protein, partial [Anaerolineaceae bacterium]
MTQPISIITDSTCDIPEAWKQEYEISIVPLTIVFSDRQYLDGVDLTAEEFYKRLPTEKQVPTTSQPTPQLFLDAYKAAATKGAKEIVVFTISSAMSGTFESARLAAEKIDIPVHIVDGKSNSMGLGWQVIAAAREREIGGGLEKMLSAAEKVRKSIAYYISLDTIDYLYKGGRISDAIKFINSVLKIRPLIYVNHETGTVGASIPARSRRNAIDGMYKEFFKNVDTSKPLHITVLHNAAFEEAKELAERVIKEFSPKEIFISIVS